MFKFLTSLLYLSSTSQLNEEKSNVVTEEDLDLLCTLVDMKDGGPTWIQMMERSTPTMNYQGWCRDPEVRFFLISCFLWPIISPKPESAEGKTFSQLLLESCFSSPTPSCLSLAKQYCYAKAHS